MSSLQAECFGNTELGEHTLLGHWGWCWNMLLGPLESLVGHIEWGPPQAFVLHRDLHNVHEWSAVHFCDPTRLSSRWVSSFMNGPCQTQYKNTRNTIQSKFSFMHQLHEIMKRPMKSPLISLPGGMWPGWCVCFWPCRCQALWVLGRSDVATSVKHKPWMWPRWGPSAHPLLWFSAPCTALSFCWRMSSLTRLRI